MPMRRTVTCGGLSRRDFCALSLAAAAARCPPQAAKTPAANGASRKWTVFVLQNSHIDIGFTDKQEILADYEAQFVRQALQMVLCRPKKNATPPAASSSLAKAFGRSSSSWPRPAPKSGASWCGR